MEHKNHTEYEINFLVLQPQTESLEKIKEQMKKMIESHKGTVTDTLEYRKRKLAYKIKHELYGFYTVFRFTLQDTSAIETLKKDLNLYQDVARYIIVRADELPPLKKKVEQTQEESVKKEKVLKQEDVEKLLAEKKIGKEKEPMPEERKAEEIVIEDKKEMEEKKVGKEKEEEKSKKKDADKKEAEKKETESKAKELKQEKQVEKEKTEKTMAKEAEKDTLDDLDKKLDEILNI